MTRQLPDVKPLADLYAIENRLQQLAGLTVLGGNAELKRVLGLVNAEFAIRYPTVEPFEAETLKTVRKNEDGSLRIILQRSDNNRSIQAEVDLPSEGNAAVSIVAT
jgi:hypothetical protein